MKGAISMFQFENKKVFFHKFEILQQVNIYFRNKIFIIQYYVLYKLSIYIIWEMSLLTSCEKTSMYCAAQISTEVSMLTMLTVCADSVGILEWTNRPISYMPSWANDSSSYQQLAVILVISCPVFVWSINSTGGQFLHNSPLNIKHGGHNIHRYRY